MTAPLRKAVFPVAGLGTRFLPATKAMPKEMLTVVDRPLIQYVVDEAREAGIEHFIMVTGRNKGVIEDHFDIQFELEATLRERGRTKELDAARPRPAARRPDQLHPPAGAARPRPRGLVRARYRRQRTLRRAAARHDHAGQARLPGADGRGLQPDRRQHHRGRGMRPGGDRRNTASSASARPSARTATRSASPAWSRSRRPRTRRQTSTSTAATSCSRRSSTSCRSQERGAGNEIQLTDAMLKLAETQPFFGSPLPWPHASTAARKLGFLVANVAFALERDDLADDLKAEIRAAHARSTRRRCQS